MKQWIIVLGLIILFYPFGQSQTLYLQEDGFIHFRSDAPLEIIEASSQKLRSVINLEKRTFAFSIKTRSFEGFNSPLQREHFNENYLETRKYPQTTFTGKIIERIDLKREGTYSIRAKGKLFLHGVEQERVIKANIVVQKNTISITSAFSIPLEEHDISVPKIVYQKIAEIIKVEVKATLSRKIEN